MKQQASERGGGRARRQKGEEIPLRSCPPARLARDPQTTIERLIRVRATRRGKPVELRVHYERVSFSGFETYQVLAVEDTTLSTSTD